MSQRISVSPEATEKIVKKQSIGQHDGKISSNREEDDECTPIPPADVVTPERSRLVVFGVAKIQKTRLLATLSGLKVMLCTYCCYSVQLKKCHFLVGSGNWIFT